jgi:hypothetical protein
MKDFDFFGLRKAYDQLKKGEITQAEFDAVMSEYELVARLNDKAVALFNRFLNEPTQRDAIMDEFRKLGDEYPS